MPYASSSPMLLGVETSRSKKGIVQSAIDVKVWLVRPPSVDEARPAACAQCEAPSRQPGHRLGLWGHGSRGRWVEGPLAPDDTPAWVEVIARRYECVVCGAVMEVVPRGVIAGYRYLAGAIASALALYGSLGKKVEEVRRRTSTTATPAGFGEACRWSTVRRWVAAAVEGRLFGKARVARPTTTWSPRRRAARIASTLAACAMPSSRHLPWEAQVYVGGVQMS